MRRPVFSRADDLDLDAGELIAAAARRDGMSPEEWAAAVLDEVQDGRVSPRRRAGSDLDSLIARMSPGSRPRPKRDYEALMAAVAAESERQVQDRSSRTAVALESMASWIAQAENRLNEATRSSVDQQDRIAAVLSQALSSLRDRLDTVERRVAEERAAPPRIEFPMEEALKALAPVSETLTGLRADMSRLATRLEQPNPAWTAAVENVRTEIDGLRSGIESLATRDEIAALDAALGSIAKDLEQGPTTRDLRTLASSITVLYEQIQSLSEEVSEGVHRRIGHGIDLLKGKIDAMGATGVDRSVVDFLSGQIVDMRQDLAHRAEPQQIARLSGEIEALGRQLSELRQQQVSKSDFNALKSSLDDICSALHVTTATAQEASRLPDQLESLERRIDLLVRRPEPAPADLTPISEQLALLTERMASLSESRAGSGDTLSGTIERLSSRIDAVAGREAPSHEPLIQRFDRIEKELRELGRQADTAGMAQMLRSIVEKLDQTPSQPAGLDALERQVAALAERFDQMPSEALRRALDEASTQLGKLQHEAAGIAEHAARTVLNDIRPSLPGSGDLDALKHGFVELKALHSRSDRKTQETLRAVHDALESLSSRLANEAMPSKAPEPKADSSSRLEPMPPADRLEAAVRRLHAVTLSHIEEASAPLPDAASNEASTASFAEPVPEADLGTMRASFIAAARRAAQSAALEPALSLAPSDVRQEEASSEDEKPDAGESASPVSSLFERLRRTLDSRHRPLLFGLAFLILTTGAYQILSVGPSLQDLPSVTAAVNAEPEEAHFAAASPAGEVSLFQSSSLSTGSIPANLPAAGQFIVDPATIKDIPADAPGTLQQAALSGDAAALFEIASRAADGRGMAKDMSAAARLFERSAQAGLPPAQERLAMMYEKGDGVPLDLKQAAFWYERAALGGNIRAMHNLATLIASGKNGKPDYAAALRWFGEAAESGLRDSQYNAGILLALGMGAQLDRAKAFQWFALAADQGDEEAAQKRDEMAGRLSAAERKAAKAALELWRPRAIDAVANQPPSFQGTTAALDRTAGDRS